MFQLNEAAGGQALNRFNGSACAYDYLTPLFFRLWDRYVEMREDPAWFWYWPNAWGVLLRCVWARLCTVGGLRRADPITSSFSIRAY